MSIVYYDNISKNSYNNLDLLNEYTDPFSDKAKQLSLEFDTATLNKNVDILRRLLDNAEKSLDSENDASKAMIYYSLGTAYDDLARLTGIQTEVAFQKVLYCFRKSINLIEQDEYTKDKKSYHNTRHEKLNSRA